ncbi:hypothetical protein Patl1_35424 [Pistacia atlantica]|nr:hypothetical protein Patl1_35424 [Pistacia atlantica]
MTTEDENDDANERERESFHQEKKRSAAGSFSGISSSPSGSDVSDSGLPAMSGSDICGAVGRFVGNDGNGNGNGNGDDVLFDVSTELTLNLPGIMSNELRKNDLTRCWLPGKEVSQKESSIDYNNKTTVFGPELMAMMQEMIREEVRNYMEEAFTNTGIKRL